MSAISCYPSVCWSCCGAAPCGPVPGCPAALDYRPGPLAQLEPLHLCERLRWNFHEYLLDRDGRVVASLPSQVAPDDPRLGRMIEEML